MTGSGIVVIGASAGGLEALEAVLLDLGADLCLPVAIVQHREKESDGRLCELLRGHCRLPVGPAEDKEPVLPGRVYVAPADYHLLVERNGGGAMVSLSTDEPVNRSRPSVDVLFESASDCFGNGVVGVVLTGSGEDGARGAAAVKERGGVVVVQDPATADAPAMPRAAIAACRVDAVLPLSEIGRFARGQMDSARGRDPRAAMGGPRG